MLLLRQPHHDQWHCEEHILSLPALSLSHGSSESSQRHLQPFLLALACPAEFASVPTCASHARRPTHPTLSFRPQRRNLTPTCSLPLHPGNDRFCSTAITFTDHLRSLRREPVSLCCFADWTCWGWRRCERSRRGACTFDRVNQAFAPYCAEAAEVEGGCEQ